MTDDDPDDGAPVAEDVAEQMHAATQRLRRWWLLPVMRPPGQDPALEEPAEGADCA